jgi:hypothetical protein
VPAHGEGQAPPALTLYQQVSWPRLDDHVVLQSALAWTRLSHSCTFAPCVTRLTFAEFAISNCATSYLFVK